MDSRSSNYDDLEVSSTNEVPVKYQHGQTLTEVRKSGIVVSSDHDHANTMTEATKVLQSAKLHSSDGSFVNSQAVIELDSNQTQPAHQTSKGIQDESCDRVMVSAESLPQVTAVQ